MVLPKCLSVRSTFLTYSGSKFSEITQNGPIVEQTRLIVYYPNDTYNRVNTAFKVSTQQTTRPVHVEPFLCSVFQRTVGRSWDLHIWSCLSVSAGYHGRINWLAGVPGPNEGSRGRKSFRDVPVLCLMLWTMLELILMVFSAQSASVNDV